MHRFRRGLLAGLLVVTAAPVTSKQVADTAFAPVIGTPRYQAGRGPKVVIDAAHLNFHSADEGYAPFAKLLRLDAEPAALAHPGVVGTTWPAPTFRGRRSSDPPVRI